MTEFVIRNYPVIHFIGNIHLNHPVLPKLALKYSQEISSDFTGRINQLFKKYKLEAAYKRLIEDGNDLKNNYDHFSLCKQQREKLKERWEKTVHSKIAETEYKWWEQENANSPRGQTLNPSDFGRIGKAQAYIRTASHNACYGFIWRRGFIGPRYKTSADCYFCNASEKDTPHHLLHECKDKRCRKFQERIRTCLPDPDLYRKVEQIIGTNSEKITIPDDVTVTILDQLFELYRYRCKLKDPNSDIDDYVY